MKKFSEWLFNRYKRLFFALLETRTLLTLPASKHAVNQYLEKVSEPKLQIGSGRNYIEGWLNTDFLAKPPKYPFLNATKSFPLPDSRFVRIYSEHMIEHIDQKSGENMLRECFRVLKPGGRIRIETPDLERMCALYSNKETADAQAYVKYHTREFGLPGYPATTCFAVNNIMRNWDHLFVYDEEMLRLAMEKAGFVNLKRYGWNVTEDEKFANTTQRAHYEFSFFETLVLEAEKPTQ